MLMSFWLPSLSKNLDLSFKSPTGAPFIVYLCDLIILLLIFGFFSSLSLKVTISF